MLLANLSRRPQRPPFCNSWFFSISAANEGADQARRRSERELAPGSLRTPCDRHEVVQLTRLLNYRRGSKSVAAARGPVIYPSQSGCWEVASKRALVLNNSYFPEAAPSVVRASRAETASWVMGRKVRAASKAWSRYSMRSMPVMTVEVGRL